MICQKCGGKAQTFKVATPDDFDFLDYPVKWCRKCIEKSYSVELVSSLTDGEPLFVASIDDGGGVRRA